MYKFLFRKNLFILITIFSLLFLFLNLFQLKNSIKEIQANCNWTGTWDTSWGKMYLIQKGDKITGTYEYDNGKIEGVVYQDVLSGT